MQSARFKGHCACLQPITRLLYLQELSAHLRQNHNTKKHQLKNSLLFSNYVLKFSIIVSFYTHLKFQQIGLGKNPLHCRENVTNSEKIFEGKFTIVLRFIGEQDIRMGTE